MVSGVIRRASLGVAMRSHLSHFSGPTPGGGVAWAGDVTLYDCYIIWLFPPHIELNTPQLLTTRRPDMGQGNSAVASILLLLNET